MKLVYRFVVTRRRYIIRKMMDRLCLPGKSRLPMPVNERFFFTNPLLTGTRIIAEIRHRRNRSVIRKTELVIAEGASDQLNGGSRYFADCRYQVPIH